MKTRRSKGGDDEHPPDGDAATTTLTLALPSDIDPTQLADIIPDISLDNPSSEDVVSIYKLVLKQAADLDELSSQLEQANESSHRKDIELDQLLQERDVQMKDIESTLTTNTSEVDKLRAELKAKGMFTLCHCPCKLTLDRRRRPCCCYCRARYFG
jgi:hypothetical protein